MDERHPVPAGSLAGSTVDELDAGRFEPGEVTLQIVGPIGDVVEGLASAAKKSSDGRVRRSGLQELHRADESDADPLSGHRLGWRAGLAGDQLEDDRALGQRVHGDADVVESPFDVGG